MNQIKPKNPLVLAIALASRGFGFAVLEGKDMLINWGVKRVTENKNIGTLAKVEELLAHYQPRVMVLQDTLPKHSKRAPRIQALNRQIVTMAARCKVSVALVSDEQVRQVFFAGGKGTKHALAEIIAQRFPEELSARLPLKRKPWRSQDSRMGIFDAVALALALQLKKRK